MRGKKETSKGRVWEKESGHVIESEIIVMDRQVQTGKT